MKTTEQDGEMRHHPMQQTSPSFAEPVDPAPDHPAAAPADPVSDPSPAPAAAPDPFQPKKQTAAEVVDRWWDDHFPGSPVARDTQAWNHAFAALQDLKRRLAAAQ